MRKTDLNARLRGANRTAVRGERQGVRATAHRGETLRQFVATARGKHHGSSSRETGSARKERKREKDLVLRLRGANTTAICGHGHPILAMTLQTLTIAHGQSGRKGGDAMPNPLTSFP